MSRIQFTGLASGLDTDSIVKAMLATQQNKIDNATNQKTKLEWKKEAWTSVNKSINDFYSKYVDKLRLKATFETYSATTSSSAVSVTTGGNMPVGKHKIEVLELATEISKSGQISSDISSKTKTFQEMGVLAKEQVTFIEVNDTKIQINSDDTLSSLEKKIKQADETLNVSFDVGNKKLFVSSKETGVDAKVSINTLGDETGLLGKLGFNDFCTEIEASKTGVILEEIRDKSVKLEELGLEVGKTAKIKLNNQEIEIQSIDTLQDLEDKLKVADSNLNIEFDLANKTFNISTKDKGYGAKIELEVLEDTTGIFSKIGISGAYGVCDNAGKLNVTGSRAIDETGVAGKYKYNGVELIANSNEVEVNGLKLTLNEVTTYKNSTDGTEVSYPVIIDVKHSSDDIVSFMKEFVSAYNELISDLNTKYNATKVSLNPLTDDEKSTMSDSQIDKYETSIKDSLLRRDSGLKTVIDTLRNTLQNVVKDNEFGSLSVIGIKTGDYSEKGKLYFDEEMFKKALEKNPDDVCSLFTSTGSNNAEGTKGIATELNSAFLELRKRVDGVKSYESYYSDRTVTDQITSYNEKIRLLKDKYSSLEKQYYKKFTAMETALSKLNSQSSSFINMLG